jgi:alpha-tubulin suppressor-like RCC1 family protein
MPGVAQTRPERPASSYGWGYNNYAGLGLGHTARVLVPTAVGLPAGTIDVQGGSDFTVALTDQGHVFTWGGNQWGQLGDGTTQHRFAPHQVKVTGSPRITSIAVGDDHVVALSRSGLVYGWGRNDLGQTGSGTLADRHTQPVKVNTPGGNRLTKLAAGNACGFAISATGAAYAWGHATPLGAGVLSGGLTATRGGVGSAVVPTLLSLPRRSGATEIDAGQRHLVVLTTSGELLTFGVNAVGRPMPETLPIHRSWGRVTAISAGDNHTLALTTNGSVLAWGSNRFGQLGTGNTENHDLPRKVIIPRLNGRIVQVIAAGDTSFARTSSRIYAWGHSGWGQHGTGETAQVLRASPVTLPTHRRVIGLYCGRYHCFASTESAKR